MLHKSGRQNNWSTLSILLSEGFLRVFAHGLVFYSVGPLSRLLVSHVPVSAANYCVGLLPYSFLEE